jgi:hypothetical protein
MKKFLIGIPVGKIIVLATPQNKPADGNCNTFTQDWLISGHPRFAPRSRVRVMGL